MSGSLVQLVAQGVQDAYLTSGDLSKSLFTARYSRHTNFSQAPKFIKTLYDQTGAGAHINVEIPNHGDLLTYLWIEGDDIYEQMRGAQIELYIGGQLVDRQSSTYLSDVWPIFLADTYTKAYNVNNRTTTANFKFFPLHFWFCDNMQHLPLIGLQYHKVEIRIITSQSIDAKLYGNFIFLDAEERTKFASEPKSYIITQVQEISTSSNVIDLTYLNHPVKSIYWGYQADSPDLTKDKFTFSECDLFLNGSLLFEKMTNTYFHSVQGYHGTTNGIINMDKIHDCPIYTRFYTYNFCIHSNEFKHSGSCNFSRLDNAKLVLRNVNKGTERTSTDITLFAVNYNILKIERGMAGVLFSN